MPTFEATHLFIFLIPGFVSSRFLDSLITRRQDKKELSSIVEALILSMIIYTIYSITGLGSPISIDQANSTISYSYDSMSFIILLGISLILPLIIAYIVNNDIHMKMARFFRITKKTSRLSIWQDILHNKHPLVIIDFTDGRRLFGWIEYFSDEADQPMYISQPQWISNGKYIPTGLDGMYVTSEQKISFIEFFPSHENPVPFRKTAIKE